MPSPPARSWSALATLTLLTACAPEEGGLSHGAGQNTTCDAGSCAGCCAPDGSCVSGEQDEACGDDGVSCADCTAVENACQEQVCVNEARTDNGMVDDSALHIRDADDAARMRQDLIDAIWGADGFPEDARPDRVEEDVASPIPTLAARTDRLTVDLGDGYVSSIYVFIPVSPTGGLAIVHQGHSPTLDVSGVDTAVAWLLDRGDIVLAPFMPLQGEYEGPAASHDEMFDASDDSTDIRPMRYFLEPVAAGLGYALDTYGPGEVTLTGVSGGGWTTTLYAALDPRVRWSLPVAGSLPLYLRTEADLGDMEQYLRPLYAMAGYLDLYVLGGWGEGRHQTQVLNRYDGCCFWGERYQDYEAAVVERTAELGAGSWSFFLDESHAGHEISEHALDAAFGPLLDDAGVQIVDDISPGWGAFTVSGDWTSWTDQGFGLTCQSAPAGSGEREARWELSVSPGTLAVYATWTAHENRASNATYTLIGDSEQRVPIDQRQSPDDLDAQGAAWTLLGEVVVSGDTLTVTLSDAADGYVIADAIRVEPLP